MTGLGASYDTSEFEVPMERAADGRPTPDWVRKVCAMIDAQGFAVCPGLLTDSETALGRSCVAEALNDPARERGTFASQLDMRFGRRDFVPLPLTPPLTSFVTMLCRRLDGVLLEFCGRSRKVLEISTLTSYRGSSHQYIHRDPSGVICLFAALEDVSPEQGGTVFIPATHPYNGGQERLGGRIRLYVDLLQTATNLRILRHNLSKLWRMRKEGRLAPGEFVARVFSRAQDNHQPNLLRFLAARNIVFDIRRLAPRFHLNWRRHRAEVTAALKLVQTAPRKGDVILYRSDMLHAGPDNCSEKPRVFFSMSIARDLMGERVWRDGYSPHASLLAAPKTLGDFLDGPPTAQENRTP